MKIKKIFDWILRRGISISYSDGEAFDPTYQDRTDGMQDIIKAKEKRDEQNRREAK